MSSSIPDVVCIISLSDSSAATVLSKNSFPPVMMLSPVTNGTLNLRPFTCNLKILSLKLTSQRNRRRKSMPIKKSTLASRSIDMSFLNDTGPKKMSE